MLVPVTANSLLKQASALFDDESNGLAREAAQAWRAGFASGTEWMQQALGLMRGEPLPATVRNFNVLGSIKYGLASVVALLPVAAALAFRLPVLVVLAVPAFYAVEVQLVFLFPLAIDGSRHPFRESRQWAVRAGGTVAAMRVVMTLAATMLFGGFVGRGFVRSWCLGCLAVCLWYESLRRACIQSVQPAESDSVGIEARSVR